jgi:ribosomal protein L20A (L18A)
MVRRKSKIEIVESKMKKVPVKGICLFFSGYSKENAMKSSVCDHKRVHT